VGLDTVNVAATTGSLHLIESAGHADIVIGSSLTLQGIKGDISIAGLFTKTYSATLALNDRNNAGSRDLTLAVTDILIGGHAKVSFEPAGLVSLGIHGGTGTNSFTITDTPSNATGLATTLESFASDVVEVQATTGPLNLFAANGLTLTVGTAG